MALYSNIEEVSASPKYGSTGTAGWGFHMWTDLLDDEAPHRRILERFGVDHPEAGIVLPEYDRYEDYIASDAKWGSSSLWVYYETILSHLWIWSDDREAVESFRAELLRYAS
ncbi:hypothetical protein [Novosphingobium organovorum]|uniref:hypothetical protein n=1 Tax=Novosphingobium organovorum TaxID=2930092 RepID=UPI001FB902B1|nr:hypothetical protein [Novosphingobium organovorum]